MRNLKRRREWRARGSATAGPESSSPLTNGGGGPQPPDIGEEIADSEGRNVRDPAARPSGGGLPRSAKDLEEDARFGLASRADPASTDNYLPGNANGLNRVILVAAKFKLLRDSKDRARAPHTQN